jgi:hypothetical protein
MRLPADARQYKDTLLNSVRLVSFLYVLYFYFIHIHPSAFVSPQCILTSAVNARPTVWTHARSQVRVPEKKYG